MRGMDDQRREGEKRFRLIGARFDGGRLPVDSLVELEKYQQVVRIAAEAEWRRDNPDQPLPDNFRESVSLSIDRIDDGSADVFLVFEQHIAYQQYQEDARDAVDVTLAAAYSGEPLPELPALTPEADREFRDVLSTIGSTLEPKQSIQFYPDAPGSVPVSITIESRRKAVQELARVEDFLQPPELLSAKRHLEKREGESLIARVTAILADKKEFFAETSDGEVHGWYRDRPQILEDLRKVVNDSGLGPLTRITGELQYKDGVPWRFLDVSDVEEITVDDSVWGARLTEFASLPSGWDDADAKQITSMALEAAQTLMQAVSSASSAAPGLFPIDTGGILIEWATAESVRSVEILPEGGFELFRLVRGKREGEHAETNSLVEAITFAKAGIV